MKRFWKILKWSMALMVLLILSYVWATHYYIDLDYIEEDYQKSKGNHVYGYFMSSTYMGIGFYRVTEVHKDPYALILWVQTDKNYGKKAELKSLELKLKGATVFNSGPLENYVAEISKNQWGQWKGMIRYSLGENLKYVEGATLEVIARMKVPYSEDIETVKIVFKARRIERSKLFIYSFHV